MSPDRTVLVVESWTGKLAAGGSDLPGDFPVGFGRNRGKLFFDVFNATTTKKLIAITANFFTILPEEAFRATGWLTERYFLMLSMKGESGAWCVNSGVCARCGRAEV
jgi:hypothetical protein